MVLWDKNHSKIFVHKPASQDRKNSMQLATDFARAVSRGLLSDRTGLNHLVDNFCKLIQIGFAYKFTEDAIDILLMTENLEIFAEDEEFLAAAFPCKVSNATSG